MSLSKHASTTYNARINFGKLLKLIPSQESQIKLLQVSYLNRMVEFFFNLQLLQNRTEQNSGLGLTASLGL